ncbi:MAG: NAD-dependent epimerase/dehydratase family protein [Propionibacteriaceae bacterium]|jgi:nucleoside-diphosphate-sugar epimerase|nr:NAD-dependent epimerase/dehydratase family protein [Propionibacteriaceae bacterium]
MKLLSNETYRQDVARVAGGAHDWNRLRGAHVVISGASGMIGSFLVDVLMAHNLGRGLDCTIQALARDPGRLHERFASYGDHPNLVLTSLDVTNHPLPIASADYVIHGASNTHPLAYAADPIATIMTNVQGTYALADLAVRCEARRLLLLSSVEIYGENHGGARFAETDMGHLDSNSLRAGYPESKRVSEALSQAFRAQHNLDVVIARLPRVFGPTMREDDTKAAAQFLRGAVAGEDIPLKSAGHQNFSYGYVADVVAAILTCLLAGETGEAYNVAHPSCDIRLKDLARIIAEVAGTRVVFTPPSDLERRGFSKATLATMDGAKLAALGWQPAYEIREAIERTVKVLKEVA